MTTRRRWIPTTQRPPEGVVVETESPAGMKQKLIYKRGLWWFPDMSMYVYYTPAKWRSARVQEEEEKL